MSEFVCSVCGHTQTEDDDRLYLVNSRLNEETERYEEISRTCFNCIPPELRTILENQGKTEGKRRERPRRKPPLPMSDEDKEIAFGIDSEKERREYLDTHKEELFEESGTAIAPWPNKDPQYDADPRS